MLNIIISVFGRRLAGADRLCPASKPALGRRSGASQQQQMFHGSFYSPQRTATDIESLKGAFRTPSQESTISDDFSRLLEASMLLWKTADFQVPFQLQPALANRLRSLARAKGAILRSILPGNVGRQWMTGSPVDTISRKVA